MILAASDAAPSPHEIFQGSLAEPLTFRSLRESVDKGNQLANQAVLAEASAAAATKHEAALRAAYEQGRSEGASATAQTMQQQVQQEREMIGSLMEQFEQEKQRYFADVEQEVVKLSLAIAERVLRRESEMDPTLLAAAARVALEQVADASEAVLKVSVDEVDRWSEAFSPSTKGMVIEGDKEIQRGECLLKTRSGTVQLGVRAQLQEIERGFFQLLERRPTMALASC